MIEQYDALVSAVKWLARVLSADRPFSMLRSGCGPRDVRRNDCRVIAKIFALLQSILCKDSQRNFSNFSFFQDSELMVEEMAFLCSRVLWRVIADGSLSVLIEREICWAVISI